MTYSSSRTRLSVIIALVVLILTAFVILTARKWPHSAGLYPLVIAIPVFVLAIADVILELLILVRGKTDATEKFDPLTSDDLPPAVAFRGGAILFSWIGGLVLVSWLIGIPAAMPIFCCSYVLVQNYREWRTALIFGLSTLVFLFVLFSILLPTAWPEPLIMRLLSNYI